MNPQADIAVVILTYNESRHLPRALKSIGSFAREVFVIDSFSTDDTVEIAKAAGASVLEHPFECQAQQFNWALDNAPITTDWVMRLDADEIIESDLAREIVTRLPLLPPEITGVNLNRKTIFQGRFIRHGGRYPLMMLRIWRRGKARVEDRWMDEHIYLTEGAAVTLKGGFADHNLNDLTSFTEKHNKYAGREALDVLNGRLGLFDVPVALTGKSTARQAKVRTRPLPARPAFEGSSSQAGRSGAETHRNGLLAGLSTTVVTSCKPPARPRDGPPCSLRGPGRC